MRKKSFTASQDRCVLPGDEFQRRSRGKASWAGPSQGDAFKHQVDYFVRRQALSDFYAACRRGQIEVARLAGVGKESSPKVKPQLGPSYTRYPANLSAAASVGLTVYLEYQALVPHRLLKVHLQDYLKGPAEADHVSVDPKAYEKVVEAAIRAAETRILLEDLGRSPRLRCVERYRLFAASQKNTKCESLAEIIDAVILYGDVLPDWRQERLHPVTRSICQAASDASQPFFDRLSTEKPHQWVALGCAWVRAVSRSLAPYLPPPGQPQCQTAPPIGDWIPPLNGPHPPMLDSPTAAQRMTAVFRIGTAGTQSSVGQEPPETTAIRKAIEAFGAAVGKAGGQETQSEDMRSDLVEQAMRASGFRESPIQGTPTEGREVEVQLGKDTVAAGTIHDRPIEMGHDRHAGHRLLEESLPITEALRQTIFTNVEDLYEIERLRTAGSLDGTRLAVGAFSQGIFKRHCVRQAANRRGAPVVAIICDHSGSVGAPQTWMLKRLTAAWLESTARTRVCVLAALYHDVSVRSGVCGPLVEWIFHPQKTPATNRREAVLALASIPDSGSGNQSDALSMGFVLDEAARLSRGKTIYVIHITDTQFCPSFKCGKDGKQEMLAFLQSAHERFGDRLHYTLVALGVEPGKSGFEQAVDRVIAISYQQLTNCTAVAEQIGVYVASVMMERQRLIARR